MGELEDLLNMLGKGKGTIFGKKLVKYDRAWILIAHLNKDLYLAVQTGAALPAALHVVKAEAREILDV